MKKLIAAIAIVMVLTTPASAATTMRWDWGKAQSSIGKAISQIISKPSFSWDRLLEVWK